MPYSSEITRSRARAYRRETRECGFLLVRTNDRRDDPRSRARRAEELSQYSIRYPGDPFQVLDRDGFGAMSASPSSVPKTRPGLKIASAASTAGSSSIAFCHESADYVSPSTYRVPVGSLAARGCDRGAGTATVSSTARRVAAALALTSGCSALFAAPAPTSCRPVPVPSTRGRARCRDRGRVFRISDAWTRRACGPCISSPHFAGLTLAALWSTANTHVSRLLPGLAWRRSSS